MDTQIFVNLPVKDLKKSMDFFKKLGFTFNPQFTDEKAACLVIGKDIYSMLLTEPFFKTFVKKDIADSTKTAEVIIAISADSKEKVDQLVDTALSTGGYPYNDTQDTGWMYSRSFQDPDHHLWEVVFMDMSKMPKS